MDPRTRIAMVVGISLAGLCLEGPVPLGILAFLPTLSLLLHPKADGWRGRMLGGIVLLVWSTVLSQGLFWMGWPRTPLFHWGPVVFWREGALHGLLQSSRFISSLAAGGLLALSTSPDRLLAALLAFRLPFGLALMASASLRFLPLVLEEWQTVRSARDARIKKRSRWLHLSQEAMLLQPLMARALRRSLVLAESLDTRGFHPTAPRQLRQPLRMSIFDYFIWIFGGSALLGMVSLRLLFLLYRWEIYYLPALRPVYGWVRAWM